MIRTARHSDIPAIIEIGQKVIDKSKTYNAKIDPTKAAYMIRRAISDKKMDVFIAEKAGKVVGFFIALKDEYWFAKKYYATDIAFCVLPEHADQGVWLLRRFIRWCNKNNIENIQLGLSTGLDPEGRTGKLYEKHGLTLVGGIYATVKEVV
ncbi:GNAT family N-acetyltransferase [Pseudoalteromonas nigrifaciens]|uniref:GNAT family N-acetyltransferase n=1 Tax=Pseudoalteromonas nigrifaciens TaxID=28109 RepID=UPI001787E404|nr:GNAT family N-acetyltransferase [Pseudoalteromonas nigrifaciens]MBE0418563.1 GNAT family N-acetyltransferase [Pseudoalteromonas nigrifaciens]